MNHTHRTLHLRQGQVFNVVAEAGQQLVAQHGSVMLTAAPHWLAGAVWRARVVIHAGQVHAVDAAGWISLSTDNTTAELLCVQAQPARTPVAAVHAFHTLLAFARRTFA